MRWFGISIAALVLVTSEGMTQERTLVGDGIESGGFGAPVVKLTQVHGELGVLAGGRGGWVINHIFVLGGGGYGLANDVWVQGLFPEPRLQFGYGGLELEAIIASNSLIHFTVAGLVGGGGVRLGLDPTDAVFVMEPQATVEINVTRFMRLNLGGGYRWVMDVDIPYLTNGDFSAPFGALGLKFGKF